MAHLAVVTEEQEIESDKIETQAAEVFRSRSCKHVHVNKRKLTKMLTSLVEVCEGVEQDVAHTEEEEQAESNFSRFREQLSEEGKIEEYVFVDLGMVVGNLLSNHYFDIGYITASYLLERVMAHARDIVEGAKPGIGALEADMFFGGLERKCIAQYQRLVRK